MRYSVAGSEVISSISQTGLSLIFFARELDIDIDAPEYAAD
jgi:hypothetical protein